MITLIVGRPRTGKTYYLVVILLERMQRLFAGRPVVSNVRGHVGVKHKIDFQDDFTDRKYDKSLIVLDEVQFYSTRDKNGDMFKHFTVHGHQERDYVWVTQSTAALPAKWLGLVERTVKIETVAGSQISRALHFVGTPLRGDEPIETETFRPRATDLYKTVEDGMSPPKRKMPSKVLFLLAAALFFVVGAPVGAFLAMKHLTQKQSIIAVSDNTQAVIDSALIKPVKIKDTVIKSVLRGDVVDSYNTGVSYTEGGNMLVRYPLSVSQALAVFNNSNRSFVGCNHRYFSDEMIRDCEKKRVRTLDESSLFSQSRSALPRNSYGYK